MKKAIILALGFLLAAGTAALGQATLPAFYSGPWSSTNLPTGWTKSGLGSDYKTDYDGSGGVAAKFDSSSDFLQIYFSGSPGAVSYYAQGNTLSGDYVYKVQESVNGSNWTDVATYNPANPLNNSTPVQYTNGLLPSSRYVKFLYVTRVGGNVGLDGVRITGPSVPTVTITPPGSTNAPASNTLTLAVSISPAGAGLESWNMVPAYAGAASLSGGSFSFTPAASDSGKTFTLSIIATNAIGMSTGTASIAVTAYVAPVPIITFRPAAPYSIMATYTQNLGIGMTPAGSGIQGWTLLPSNYAGSAILAGTNFTFTTAQADGPGTYILTVIATNVYGITTGTASIAVTEYIAPPPPGAQFIDFESTSKPNYPVTNVTINGKSWELAESLIGNLAGDQHFGSWSLRMRYSTDLLCAMTSQSKLITNGVGAISLWYSSYGTNGNSDVMLAIEVSENLDSGWVELDSFGTMGVTNLTRRAVDVYVNTPVYVRIRAKSGLSENRANVDNITITDYAAPATSPYDAFLLKYNVTPGDPGTGPDDDLDGDGVTNTNEFIADTNPYVYP